MKGRKPKPIEQQIAAGDPRKHGTHRLEQALAEQPKATTGLPPCPKHLTDRGKAAWKFWSAELQAMRLDKRPDGPMLEGACRAYDRAVQADLIVDQEGLIVQDKGFVVRKIDGVEHRTMTVKTKKHPAVDISNKAWLLVRAFCSEFGLSPVSRMRIKAESAGDDGIDDLAALLSQPRDTASERVQ